MKHELLFEETIKSLGIQVYTEGFTAEQIFYQIESKTKDRFSKMEKMIRKNSSNPKKETSFIEEKENYSSEYSDDNEDNDDSISNSDNMNSTIDSDMEENSIISDNIDDYSEDDNKEQSDADSVNFSSEESIEIEAELWDENLSDTEILNLPACEVMKILRKK